MGEGEVGGGGAFRSALSTRASVTLAKEKERPNAPMKRRDSYSMCDPLCLTFCRCRERNEVRRTGGKGRGGLGGKRWETEKHFDVHASATNAMYS